MKPELKGRKYKWQHFVFAAGACLPAVRAGPTRLRGHAAHWSLCGRVALHVQPAGLPHPTGGATQPHQPAQHRQLDLRVSQRPACHRLNCFLLISLSSKESCFLNIETMGQRVPEPSQQNLISPCGINIVIKEIIWIKTPAVRAKCFLFKPKFLKIRKKDTAINGINDITAIASDIGFLHYCSIYVWCENTRAVVHVPCAQPLSVNTKYGAQRCNNRRLAVTESKLKSLFPAPLSGSTERTLIWTGCLRWSMRPAATPDTPVTGWRTRLVWRPSLCPSGCLSSRKIPTASQHPATLWTLSSSP